MSLLDSVLSILKLFSPAPQVVHVPSGRKYGWIKDKPDANVSLYAMLDSRPEAVPAAVDLRPLCPAVYDQGQLGSCSANAIGGHLHFNRLKNNGDNTPYSRLFLYFNERLFENDTSQDAGAAICDGIRCANTQGICKESSWPYDISQFAVQPPMSCYGEAKQFEAVSYHRIQSLQEMKQCLFEGYPFVFGFQVHSAFEGPEVAQTGILNLPGLEEQNLGGHAVMCVGYDDATQRVIVRNSWGSAWGQSGYFTMPYAYITNEELASDMWTLR